MKVIKTRVFTVLADYLPALINVDTQGLTIGDLLHFLNFYNEIKGDDTCISQADENEEPSYNRCYISKQAGDCLDIRISWLGE